MMMKGDVLSGFEKLKVCTSYNYNGKKIEHLPYSILEENVTPLYKEFPGWEEDLTQLTSESELPENFMSYVSFLEKELEVPISIISVGPDRKQTIHR